MHNLRDYNDYDGNGYNDDNVPVVVELQEKSFS